MRDSFPAKKPPKPTGDHKPVIPPLGQVRLIAITDHQFAKWRCFMGKNRESPEEIPEQILLF